MPLKQSFLVSLKKKSITQGHKIAYLEHCIIIQDAYVNSQNIPIDPTVIDRNTLIQDMVEMDAVQNMRSTEVKAKEEALVKLTRDMRWRTFKNALNK